MKVAQLAARLSRHRDTIFRWIRHGVRGPGGQTVRLNAVRVGGTLSVRACDWREFRAALNPEAARQRARSEKGTLERARRAARRLGWKVEG